MEQVQPDPVAERVTIERLDDGTLRWHRYNRDAGGAENIPDLPPAETLMAISRVVQRADAERGLRSTPQGEDGDG